MLGVNVRDETMEEIVARLLPEGGEPYLKLITAFVETLVRYVDPGTEAENGFFVKELPATEYVTQVMAWEEGLVTCLSEGDGGLLAAANKYSGDTQTELSEDALDAVGELLNCANGVYVSALSRQGSYLELLPPGTEELEEPVKPDTICRIPLIVLGKKLFLAVAELQ